MSSGAPAGSRLHLGTSGFSFEEWLGPFYPADLKPKAMLRYYAERLGTVEINYTFRHFPSEKTLAGWVEETPEGFVFSVKAHQRITHTKRLKEAAEALDLIARLGQLGSRLGPLLFQCPPNMKLDADRLSAFLGALPQGPRYAFEFRHPSWQEAADLVREAGAAFVVSETDEEPFSRELDATRFCYLRLRKTSYGEPELDVWADRIAARLRAGGEVFAYFKHEDDGLGPKLAASLREAVGARTGDRT